MTRFGVCARLTVQFGEYLKNLLHTNKGKLSITSDLIFFYVTSVGTVHLLTIKYIVNVCRIRAVDDSSLGRYPALGAGGLRQNSVLKF